MAARSPTQRTLARLREIGYIAQVVEHWNPYGKCRVDLFGCIDIVAVHKHMNEVLGIQTTTGTNHARRRAKALASPALPRWIAGGARFEIWSWTRKRNGRWVLRIERFMAFHDGRAASVGTGPEQICESNVD